MSFDRYSPSTILPKLSALKVQLSSSVYCSGNLLQRSTFGLALMFQELRAQSSTAYNGYPLHEALRPLDNHGNVSMHPPLRPLPSRQFEEYYTDENGFLQPKNSSQFRLLIQKRYEVIDLIEQGSFSQVFKVRDTWRNRLLVLKLIRRGCEVLGWREKIFLEHLEADHSRGASCFVRCMGWVDFADHIGLLLPFYSHTLLPYMLPSSTTEETNPHSETLPVPLLQPKARNGFDGVPITSSQSLIQNTQVPSFDGSFDRSLPHSGSRQRLESADIDVIRKIALSLVSALLILHKEGIIHGDIKPENIFIDSALVRESSLDGDSTNFEGNSSSTLSSLAKLSLRSLSKDCSIRLGDFGNSIHVSEVKDYFTEFEIQSLPYRAPEVLVGLPFNTVIDIWSAGMLLVELCINKPLFTPRSRQEAIHCIESQIGKLDRVRFSGAIFSHLLFESDSEAPTASAPSTAVANNREINNLHKAVHIESLKRLVAKHITIAAPKYEVAEMLDFLGHMLMLDPNHRSSAKNLLPHSFLSPLISIPLSLIGFSGTNGTDGQNSRKRKIQAVPFHSLKRNGRILTPNESKESPLRR